MPEVKDGDKPAGLRPGTGLSVVSTAGVFADIIWKLSRLEWPVIDKTGLTARYHFDMTIDRDQDAAPAIQEQLGLKLTPKRDPIEVLVIDHAEKVPAGN